MSFRTMASKTLQGCYPINYGLVAQKLEKQAKEYPQYANDIKIAANLWRIADENSRWL